MRFTQTIYRILETCFWSAFAIALLVATVPASAASLGVDFATTPSNYDEGNVWNLGYEFQVNSAVTVTGLGGYNSPTGWGGTQEVGLWDADGNLIASAMVTNSDTAIGDWYFASIAPVALVVGEDYIVGAQGGSNFAGELPMNVNPDITYVEDQYFNFGEASPLTPLTEPTGTEDITSPSSAGWFGGNVEFGSASAPEPGTDFLVAAGLLGLGLFRRTKKHASLKSERP